jgi:dipeptidyl aminopeptidase/acylaminoacyl peptidase
VEESSHLRFARFRAEASLSRQPHTYYEAGITRFEEHSHKHPLIRLLVSGAVLLVLLWVGIPVARTIELLANPFHRAPTRPIGLSVQSVAFRASDGVPLQGWFAARSARDPAVILIPGFKADRVSMLPYARFLYAAGYNVLLYDSRGTGASGGAFSMGVREVDDVRGAVAYLDHRPGLRNHHYGLLGVSLGAGVAIVAAAHLRSVIAVVADSAYTDQRAVVDRLDTVRVGGISIPLAPVAPWLVDRILGVRLASFSPLHMVGAIAPRALLLIHSRHDANPTTPQRDVLALYHAAGSPVSLWIAPHGGHAGALAAQPTAYRGRVVAFFKRYLR